MRDQPKMLRATVGRSIAAGIVVAAVIGGTIGGVAAADKSGPSYPVNKLGLTYGSAADANTTEQEPDLIWVVGTGGKEGYIRKTDLAEIEPKSPEEAVRQQNSALSKSGRTIPVYDVSGQKVVDTFHIVGTDDTEEDLVAEK